MKKAIVLVNLGVAILAAGTLVYAAVDSGPRATLMSAGDYQSALKEIENEARASSVVCKRLTGYEKNVCTAEQGAERKVRMAELEARYLGTVESKHSARLTYIEAQHDVDKARCEAFESDERNHCLLVATGTRAALTKEARSPA